MGALLAFSSRPDDRFANGGVTSVRGDPSFIPPNKRLQRTASGRRRAEASDDVESSLRRRPRSRRQRTVGTRSPSAASFGDRGGVA